MSTETNECPYLRGFGHQTICCMGVGLSGNMEMSFVNAADCLDYKNRFCRKHYYACRVARCLDEVTRTCQYCSGVDCSQTDACGKCGWNPDVSAKRLAMFYESGK